MRDPAAVTFEIPQALWRVLRHFETECVGGCCGRRAFHFDAESIAAMTTGIRGDETDCPIIEAEVLRQARRELRELVPRLKAIAGPVDTMMITDTWDGPRAARWFAAIERLLERRESAPPDMPIRDPVDTELNFRPELTPEQRAILVEWAVQQKCVASGGIRARGTDPAYPGSTFWEVGTQLRVVSWPEQQRLWITHKRKLDEDSARVVRFLAHVLDTHPPTRH